MEYMNENLGSWSITLKLYWGGGTCPTIWGNQNGLISKMKVGNNIDSK